MKKMKLLLTLSLFSLGAAFAGTPIETTVPITDVFVPFGFDSNDSSEVVVSGHLPNLCHRSPKTEVKIEGKKIFVTVTALKYEANNPFCPEIIVPFLETVSLGLLKGGSYKVHFNKGTRSQKAAWMNVQVATENNKDDFIYAQVDYLEKTPGSRSIRLIGYTPSSCLEFDQIKYYHNKKNTYSILPIMKQVSDFCPKKPVKFEYDWEVPNQLQTSNILLHVRSLEGHSVNSLFVNAQE